MARELGDVYLDRLRAGQITELELVRSGIDVNLDCLLTQRWGFQTARLRQTLTDAPEVEKAAAKRALDDHYGTCNQSETSRAGLMRDAIVAVAPCKHA